MLGKGLVLWLLPLLAGAGQAQLSWTNPTQYTTGETIPLTGTMALASTRVEYFQCTSAAQAWPGTSSKVVVPVPQTAYLVTGLTDSKLYCFRVVSVLAEGTESTPSAIGTKTAFTPGTGTIVPGQVTLGGEVSYMTSQKDRVVMFPVGTVPAGIPCDCTQQVNGNCVVPTTSVTWYGSVKPLVVVGSCG